MAKKGKKKKFNYKRFFKFLLFLVCFILIIYYFSTRHIKSIVVKGNTLLSDETIIETAKIENYPRFLKPLSSTIEKRIKTLDLVKSVKVKKWFNYQVIIDIEEYKVLFKMRNTGEYVLSGGKRISDLDTIAPTLVNYVPEDILNRMVNKFDDLDNDVLDKVSEIEYSPTTYDSERFVLYMNDENMVYITLNKVKEFSKYNQIKTKLGNNKGILYLDSGNYFEIKE